MWLRQPSIQLQALWGLCGRGLCISFPAVPHHSATFLCHDGGGGSFLLASVSHCPLVSYCINPPVSSLPSPPLQNSKIGSPAPEASGEYEAKMKNGPMTSPLPTGYQPSLHWLLPSPTKPAPSRHCRLQPRSSPGALASLNSKPLPPPFHLLGMPSFP